MNISMPKVGIATIVKSRGLILLGQRVNSIGHGTWSFPGGKLEKFETFFECAKRELYEETGLLENRDVIYLNKNPLAITNDLFKEEGEHYITLFLEAEQISKKFAEVKEKNKCKCWEYVHWEDIINKKYDPLFLPIQNLIKQEYTPYI